jgi:hypothetical protein
MPTGRLSFRRENADNLGEAPRYRSRFDEQGGEHGAQGFLDLDNEGILNFLIGLQNFHTKLESREDRARQWVMELRSTGSLVLDPVDLTEAQAARYRRAV